jgi:signal transduction histidine kinase
MQNRGEEIKIAILIVTFIILLFSLTIVFLIFIFNKKKHLAIKEREINTANFNQAILKSQLEIQEQTFTNISQEIHDNVGQILSLAKVQLNIMEENVSTDKHLLQEVSENISNAMTDLRDIAKGLNSERIKGLGLLQALQQETIRINRSGILNIHFTAHGIEKEIDQQKQLILFRIVQECFQNIIKHAEATVVQVYFSYSDSELLISISDNGKGFDLQKAQNTYQGLGLSNIFKRIELIGGKVEIESVLQGGTTTKLNINYV